VLNGYRFQNSLSNLGLDTSNRYRCRHKPETIMSNARTPRTLTTDEQETLLYALHKPTSPTKTCCKGIRNYLIACLMLDAGLRVGEVVQLTISHLWFNGQPVRSLVLTSDITKNHKERVVPVNSRLSNSIDDYFSHVLGTVDCHPSFQVFSAPQSKRCLTTRQVEHIITGTAMAAIGRPINPHMLRHTFGSKLLRVTNIRTVQELLGHSCITSTQIYTHPNEEDKRKAILDSETQDSQDPQAAL